MNMCVLLFIVTVAGLILQVPLHAESGKRPGERREDLMTIVKKIQPAIGKREEEEKALKAFLAEYDGFSEDIAESIRTEGGKLKKRYPQMREPVDRETRGFPVTRFKEAPVVLSGTCFRDRVTAREESGATVSWAA